MLIHPYPSGNDPSGPLSFLNGHGTNAAIHAVLAQTPLSNKTYCSEVQWGQRVALIAISDKQ
jgi:hypothetical protein